MLLALYDHNNHGNFDCVFIVCEIYLLFTLMLHYICRTPACGCVINNIYIESIGHWYALFNRPIKLNVYTMWATEYVHTCVFFNLTYVLHPPFNNTAQLAEVCISTYFKHLSVWFGFVFSVSGS